MPNAVNYNVSAQTQALKKGNFWIATGDVGKGAGYWNGITPPLSGYTIYLNKSSNGPAIYTVSTEAQLTGLTSTIAGQTLTTSGACLNWFATQTDKMILNKDYGNIVTNGLVLSYDAGFTPSYPTTGTTWYDMGPSGKTQTLYNGPTYSNGSIVFDGVDDYTNIPSINGPSLQTIEILFNANSNSNKTLLVGKPVYRPRISLRNNIVNVYYGMETGTGDIIFTFNSITTSQFYQLVYTYSGSTNHKCYLNTVEGTRTSNGSAINGIPNFTSLDLGILSGSEGYFNGKISAFRLYDRVLTSAEIQQNYLATINPKFIFGSNLKIWYDMSLQPSEASVDNVNTIDSSNNLVTLSRVYDLSGNGKHLTQSAKTSQPTFIPNSQNGKPANYNNGASVGSYPAMFAPGPGLTTGDRSFFIVLKGPPTSAFSWDRGGATPGSLQLGYAGINGWNDLQQDIGVIGIGGGNDNTTYVMSYLFDTNQTLLYRNGNLNRAQTNNTFTLNGYTFGCWWTAPSAGSQNGSWYEMVYLNKIPTIAEYNALVTYLGTKWGVSCGTLTNYN
jgi:hypothetical protein